MLWQVDRRLPGELPSGGAGGAVAGSWTVGGREVVPVDPWGMPSGVLTERRTGPCRSAPFTGPDHSPAVRRADLAEGGHDLPQEYPVPIADQGLHEEKRRRWVEARGAERRPSDGGPAGSCSPFPGGSAEDGACIRAAAHQARAPTGIANGAARERIVAHTAA